MNKDVLIDLKYKKGAHNRSKQGKVIQKEYKDFLQLCRDGLRRTKAHLELHLERDMQKRKA